MSVKSIKSVLEKSLLKNGKMYYALYEYELEERVEELKQSMADDGDKFIFSVTENNGHSAMLLIDWNNQVYINEKARTWLKKYWAKAYTYNMNKLIPSFAEQINDGAIPINGVQEMPDDFVPDWVK